METEQIGQLYLPDKTQLLPEVSYRYDQQGYRLLIVEETVSAERMKLIGSGVAEFAFYEDGPVIFFLYCFGDQRWDEAPFSWYLTPRAQRVQPNVEQEPEDMRIILVDATDGLIKMVRRISLVNEFGHCLQQAVAGQAAGNFNGQSYAKHLNGVWNQMSVEDMLENADTRLRVADEAGAGTTA